MTELNLHYKSNPRPIQRVKVDLPTCVIWEVQMPTGWVDMVQSKEIEMEFLKKEEKVAVILPDGLEAYLYFGTNVAVRKADGTSCKVKRTEIDPVHNFQN